MFVSRLILLVAKDRLLSAAVTIRRSSCDERFDIQQGNLDSVHRKQNWYAATFRRQWRVISLAHAMGQRLIVDVRRSSIISSTKTIVYQTFVVFAESVLSADYVHFHVHDHLNEQDVHLVRVLSSSSRFYSLNTKREKETLEMYSWSEDIYAESNNNNNNNRASKPIRTSPDKQIIIISSVEVFFHTRRQHRVSRVALRLIRMCTYVYPSIYICMCLCMYVCMHFNHLKSREKSSKPQLAVLCEHVLNKSVSRRIYAD